MSTWCIGIDFGGTFIKLGLLDRQLQLASVAEIPTPARPGDIVPAIVAGAGQLMSRHNVQASDVAGVGIGSPGPLDAKEGVIIALPNIPGMENLPIRDMVRDQLKTPVILENDANVAGYGEWIAGAGKGTRNMVFLTLGTGVGSGLIVEGRMVAGDHGVGAECGHIIVQPEGELCGCGQRGCLERYSSASYIAERVERRVKEAAYGGVLKELLTKQGKLTTKDIVAAANAGDELARTMWDEGMYYLALGCISICRILDPQQIVLGGGMAQAGDDLLGPVTRHFLRQHWRLTKPLTRIVLAELGNNAGIIGAAGLAWEAFGGGKAPGH